MVVEAKAPDVALEVGYREASLYARHINQNYPTTINPCRFILTCNGKEVLFGYWDSVPIFSAKIDDLRVGSADLARLIECCGLEVLESHAIECVNQLRNSVVILPYNLAGGPAILNAKKAVNPFADLSPLLRKYFSSTPDSNKEIVGRGYVNSAEITEYGSHTRGTAKRQTDPTSRRCCSGTQTHSIW